jgi:hypothetical protein
VLLPPLTSTRASPCARPLTVLSSRSCKGRNEYDVTKCFGFLIGELRPSRYTRMRIEHSIVHFSSNPKAYLCR